MATTSKAAEADLHGHHHAQDPSKDDHARADAACACHAEHGCAQDAVPVQFGALPLTRRKSLEVAKVAVLSVPELCCPTEAGMVERALKGVTGVKRLSPDFLRRQVRVEHVGLTDEVLLAAARTSGLTVEVATAATALPSATSAAAIELSTLLIQGMDCPTEEALIRKRLASVPEVESMSFDLLQRKLAVGHAPGSLPTVLAALEDIGLGGSVEPPPDAVQGAAGSGPTVAKAKRTHWRLIAGGVAAAGAELLAVAVGDHSLGVVALALTAVALTGLQTFKKGWYAVRQLNLNINALMAVAVTGAAVIGQWPEAAMVMFLFAVAEEIESRSLDRARRAVESLMVMAPTLATVKTATGWEAVPSASVAVGSVVRVRPGERIALDGAVLTGNSTVDQAPITGESVPVDKGPGDALFAGTVNQHNELEYTTTALASESTLAHIVHSVQEAQASKAPTQRFVDSFAAYYTPIVFGVAVAVAVLPPLAFGADWLVWVYRALVMLVIACPCALVISTPVAVVSGLTAAARRGILIKGGLYLEQGHGLTVMALDKTGTLTKGRPMVTELEVLDGSKDEVLLIAAALAVRSDHPVSRAIGDFAGPGLTLPDATAFKALAGRGVEAIVGGVLYRLGNHRLVEETGVCSPALETKLGALEEQGKTVIVLTDSERPLAIFAVADAVRAHSREAVAALKSLGIKPVMLTGDNRHTAGAIAREVGIDDVRAELLPDQKLQAIRELGGAGGVTGMVGDGINDAPALAAANIGFAMGAAGTDSAIETADVALMDDDPRKLAEFVRLSRATRAVLVQNIVLALGIKAVFLGLAVAGQATLWMAVFADMGASLIVVANGLRLLRWESATSRSSTDDRALGR